MKKIWNLKLGVLPQLAHSPHFIPSDFHLFLARKRHSMLMSPDQMRGWSRQCKNGWHSNQKTSAPEKFMPWHKFLSGGLHWRLKSLYHIYFCNKSLYIIFPIFSWITLVICAVYFLWELFRLLLMAVYIFLTAVISSYSIYCSTMYSARYVRHAHYLPLLLCRHIVLQQPLNQSHIASGSHGSFWGQLVMFTPWTFPKTFKKIHPLSNFGYVYFFNIEMNSIHHLLNLQDISSKSEQVLLVQSTKRGTASTTVTFLHNATTL